MYQTNDQLTLLPILIFYSECALAVSVHHPTPKALSRAITFHRFSILSRGNGSRKQNITVSWSYITIHHSNI